MRNPRRQGDLGEFSAIEWLGSKGYPVWIPVGHSPDYDLVAVPVGAFADPSFPPPTESGYDSRRHSWLAVPTTIERRDGQ